MFDINQAIGNGITMGFFIFMAISGPVGSIVLFWNLTMFWETEKREYGEND